MERVVIVGGGVLGVMHALQARQRGLDVVHLEREAGARGASVRNFGLVWVSGRAPGPELALAQRARTLWEELAARCPAAGFRPHGSLTVARTTPSWPAQGGRRESRTRPSAASSCWPRRPPRASTRRCAGEFAGALLCRRDAIVEPRLVPRAFRDSPAGGQPVRARLHLAARPGGGRGRAARGPRPHRRSGTAATWSCCAPAPRTPASPARIWRATSAAGAPGPAADAADRAVRRAG